MSKLLELTSINEREEEINNRERKWDYEIDLIVSKKSKEVILNMIERKEIRSITTDNGPEFTDLIDICKELWIKGYRCNPYSSWEKWSVEVHNRYIRRYIPKWADIRDYLEEY